MSFRTISFFVLTLFLFNTASAQIEVKFTSSKITAHLLMLFNGERTNESSRSYRKYLKENVPGEDPFWKAALDFNGIDWWHKTIHFTDIPEDLYLKTSNVKDIIFKMSMVADSYEEFFFLTAGLLSFEETQKLKDILLNSQNTFEKYYWNKYDELNQKRVKTFEAENEGIQIWANKIAAFYGNKSQGSILVNINTTPGDGSHIKAFAPSGWVAVVGLSEKIPDLYEFIGVVIHEIAHEMEHSRAIKKSIEIDSLYKSIDDFASEIAHGYIDEALPCALGNAMAYEDLAQKPYDKDNLYNDKIITDFANNIFPLTKSYIDQGKEIDEAFVKESVSIFNKTVPDIRTNKNTLLFDLEIFFEAAAGMDRDWISYQIRNNFPGVVRSVYDGVKISDIDEDDKLTNLIFIHTNHEKNYQKVQELLGKRFPKNLDLSKEYILFDEGNGAPNLVFIMKNSDQVEPLLKTLSGLNLEDAKGTILFKK